MTRLIPEGFAFAADASAGVWYIEGLRPWGNDRVRLWSFMPNQFDRYIRVFHPFYGPGMTRVGWSELAARHGLSLSPTTRFSDVSGDDGDDAAWEHEPSDGTLVQEQVSALRDALTPFTKTPQRCWLAVWVGWGSWRPGSRSTLVAATEARLLTSDPGQQRHEPPADAIQIRTQHREYFLLSAPLELIPSFEIMGWHQSPSIWWPDDRAWCVVTEVDGYSTYVGGTAPCVDAVIASPRLEAIGVPADVPMDPGPY